MFRHRSFPSRHSSSRPLCSGPTNLKSSALSDNKIGSPGAAGLAGSLGQMARLEALDLRYSLALAQSPSHHVTPLWSCPSVPALLAMKPRTSGLAAMSVWSLNAATSRGSSLSGEVGGWAWGDEAFKLGEERAGRVFRRLLNCRSQAHMI